MWPLSRKPNTWKSPLMLSCSRYFSADHLDPANEKQRNEVDRFRKLKKYNEELALLEPSRGSIFKNMFSGFRPLNYLKDTDWSLDNIKLMLEAKKRETEIYTQRFDEYRFTELGFDVGVAHFVVYRKGAVKFCGQDKWVRWTNEKKYTQVAGLPLEYDSQYYIEGIDMSNTRLHYEGLANFVPLKRLTYLNLSNSELVNDWFLDFISNFQFLQYLDLSNCPNITYRGVSILYKIDTLKALKISSDKNKNSPEFKLACLNLLNYKPDLRLDMDPTATWNDQVSDPPVQVV